MPNSTLHLIKIKTKRLVGSCVYSSVLFKNKVSKTYEALKKEYARAKQKPLSKQLLARWKGVSVLILIFFGFYYGLGAIISSQINNKLDVKPKAEISDGQHLLYALDYVIKSQVDASAWTPALPIIFPAAVLDNLPSFQIGVKDSATYFIKNLAKISKSSDLKEAGTLLNYPADIWLFSQTKDDMIAPGSAKQYRKALAHLETAINNKQTFSDLSAYKSILKNTNKLLDKEITSLHKHIREHEAEILDFKADDAFYKTLGTIYTLHYVLSAVAKDFRKEILATEQYENITSALKFLEDAENLNPISVKNASPNDAYEANHLFYLAFYLSLTQNKVQEIYYQSLLRTTDTPYED